MHIARAQSRSRPKISNHDTEKPALGNLLQLYELQEQVAQRIANRLHDECSQMLAVIYLALADIAGDCPNVTARRIDGVVRHLDDVGEQLRSLSHELRPLVLDRFGLEPALKLLIAGVGKRTGLELVLHMEDIPVLDRMTETALYRIVQEALANVIRHADASKVAVVIRGIPGQVSCTVSDNGRGFDTACGNKGSGLGLLGISERVTAMRGRSRIDSASGKGTRLFVELPA